MLIPMSPDGSPGLVPDVVKTFHIYGWYMVIFLLSIQSLGEILSGDAFAGIIFAIMAGIVIYMIHDGCKNMTMYCLFMLGIMSGFQCFFDILGLLSVLGGRETTSSTVEGTDQDVTVITKITMHPFFDKKMDDQYNLQSLMMLLSPGVMSVSCTMCYLSYNAFSDSLFELDDEADPIYSRGFATGQPPSSYGVTSSPRRTPPVTRAFEGAGHRLSG